MKKEKKEILFFAPAIFRLDFGVLLILFSSFPLPSHFSLSLSIISLFNFLQNSPSKPWNPVPRKRG